MSKQFLNFGNLYFLNEAAQLYHLEQFSNDKLEKIEVGPPEDFVDNFKDWASKRSLSELLLIWLVLKELEKDALNLDRLVDEQGQKYNIPSWLALSGTLAFYSIHSLNKILIEEEISSRNVSFESYSTAAETTVIANNKIYKIDRKLLSDLKAAIYQDQLNESYFQELADTITEMILQH